MTLLKFQFKTKNFLIFGKLLTIDLDLFLIKFLLPFTSQLEEKAFTYISLRFIKNKYFDNLNAVSELRL